MLHPVEIPATIEYQLARLQYIDLTIDYDVGVQRLLKDLSTPAPPRLTLPPQNIPRSGAVEFVGQDQDLSHLHQTLQQQGQIPICTISGMGGLGKTELAIQYAQRYWQSVYAGV